MRKRNRFSLTLPLLFAGIALFGSPTSAEAGKLETLVPAYFYPGTGGAGGVGDGWAQMATAAQQIGVTAILNPNSGPLPGPADLNYVNAMTNLELAGGKVVAYVSTKYTVNSLATAEGNISTYITQYGGLINGFFVDEMTNTNAASNLTYYHTLYAFIKGLNPSFRVFGNPGTSTVPEYLAPATQGADTLVTYENQASLYAGFPPPTWVNGFTPDHFANILFNESSAAGMMADLNLAALRNVNYVYVTERTLPNPYSQLPSYWNQEVAAIQSAAVPEPTTMTMLATGGLLLAVAVRMRSGNQAHI